MKLKRTHWVNRLAAFGLVVGLTVGFASAGNAQSASGQAYGAYVSTPTASLAQSPLAALSSVTDGDISTASADALGVPSTLSASFLNSRTVGSAGTAGASAQSIASVANVDVLSGLITAKEVIASATSTRGASGASSSSNGSTFENLTVAGVPVTSGDASVAPNTRMDLPGVGYVVLNEQVRSGDGWNSSGITVNMIHVVLQQPILGLLGQVIGYQQVGEIVVGSASSRIN